VTVPDSGEPSGYRPAPVRLVDPDPAWPAMFAAEAVRIRAALGDCGIALEHVGSTAVPGLRAKPVIDILAAVRDECCLGDVVERLAGIGYLYTPEAERDDPARRVFRKGPADMALSRSHHLHLAERDGHYWRRLVAFRDRLRVHPEEAAAYVALKERLAARFEGQSRRYTSGKHAFVAAVEAAAGVTPER
jgi:GrpB-like predicted nucleotidyltransferase (UPF0157 family)